jgi:hypothetical protein
MAKRLRIIQRCLQPQERVWQTFEGISGRLPRVIAALKPFLRSLSNTLERLPGARRFGVSQVLICRKP